jgi:eukaryotic-like serine/threonine-protein kinase
MLAPGTRLGPYEILSPLGAGGMGEVYRAADERLKREVAVKVLSRLGGNDPERLKRFEQEARAASALSHPNILTIFDVGETDGVPFVVSELLEGETLRARLARGPLPPRKVVDFARELARGLAVAHEAGIVHRDLKPENVFLTKDGRLKILDFGLAKIVGTSGSRKAAPDATTMTALTDSGFVVGTAGYMSPEQVRGLPVDHRSDIFSFGSILYEMLTGKRAFQGASAVETMNAVLTTEPPEVPSASAVTPPGLERILRHCLEKERDDRFQSTRDLAFHLDALSSISSAALSLPEVRAAPAAARRRPLLLAGASLLAAVAAAAAVWLFAARRTPEPARYHQLTFRRGTILTARFAKDGESIVYGAAWDGEPFRVFAMRAASPESAAVALPPADVLSISASEELALALNRRFAFGWITSGTLARAPFSGGAPRELLERVQEADWAPDGSLAIVRRVEGRMRLESPQGRVLFDTPSWVSHPRVSPDGSRIAFLDHPVYADDHGAVTVVRAGEPPRRLTPVYASAQGICWTPDGREIWFSASEKGANTALLAVTLQGRVRTVTRAPGRLRLLDISRSGRVLVTRESSVASVFVRGPGGREERDLSWLDRSTSEDLSADGAKLLLNEEGEGAGASSSVFLRGTDGSPAVRLGDGVGTSLSSDGKWAVAIVFGSPSQLWLLPTGPGEPKLVPRGPIEQYHWARLLPDGARVLISGNEKGGGVRLFVQEIGSATTRPITPEGTGYLLPPSPDGKLVPSADSEGHVSLYPVDGGEPRPLPGVDQGDEILLWSADGRSLLVRRRLSLPVRIDRVDVATGKVTLWREIAPVDRTGMTEVPSVRVSADESTFTYTVHRLLSELYVADGLR